MTAILPESAEERKNYPLYRGLLKYFPDALLEVCRISKEGNDQHHPDEDLHWDKGKSNDHEDALLRHLMERDMGKVAWRALAALQTEIEREREEDDNGKDGGVCILCCPEEAEELRYSRVLFDEYQGGRRQVCWTAWLPVGYIYPEYLAISQLPEMIRCVKIHGDGTQEPYYKVTDALEFGMFQFRKYVGLKKKGEK